MRCLFWLLFVPTLAAAETGDVPKETVAPPALLAHPIPSLQENRAGQAEVLTLTLEQSINEALHTATAVQKAKGDSEITGEQLLQGYAEFLPNLTASGTSNRTVGRAYLTTATPTLVDSNSRGPGYQISSSINIFNGLNDLGALRAAVARKDAADLTLRRAKQEIALDVAQTFLQVILDQDLVRIAKENLVSSRAREALLSEQTRVGVRNLADLFRQQAQTSSDEAFLVSAESKERNDELLFLRKLRRDATQNCRLIPPKLEEEAKGNPFEDENELIKTALGNRVDLTASERLNDAASWDVTVSRASYFPRLDFGANVASSARLFDRDIVNGSDVTASAQTAGFGEQLAHQVEYTVGFTLTWTFFDRWSTATAVQKAKVYARNARLDQEDRRNQVVSEVRQAYGDYRAILQQLESSKKGLVASHKAYEVMKGRYEVGSASFVDLTTAQATLVQAEAARAQALIAFALQTRSLQTALGTVTAE